MSNFPSSKVTELIEQARQGDEQCRQQLFGLCRSYLAMVARAQVESWLRTKVDASDLVQETLLEAHRDFDRFRGESEQEWLAWLCKILHHNAADFVRRYRGTDKRQVRREKRLAVPADSVPGGVLEPAATTPSPSEELSRLDRELRVATALAQLPPDYQEVIVLRNLERLPFNEVADRMGRSRPAAQMLWMRAVKKLELALGGEP